MDTVYIPTPAAPWMHYQLAWLAMQMDVKLSRSIVDPTRLSEPTPPQPLNPLDQVEFIFPNMGKGFHGMQGVPRLYRIPVSKPVIENAETRRMLEDVRGVFKIAMDTLQLHQS